MSDLKLDRNMTLGQVVDAIADDYFAKGVDAFTANLLALSDVCCAYDSFSSNVTELVSSILRGPDPSEEVPGDE